ncbi:MAG: DNA-processing protein DprA [candidate division Zixibacteria bacterium]|nr:DNA-processing protein DprA [candidate division Zixibacteria bacterium]
MNKEIAILQLMHTKGIGQKKLSFLLRLLNNENIPIEEFVQFNVSDMIDLCKLKEETAIAISESYDKCVALSEELNQHEIKIMQIGDDEYPKKLQNILNENSPPVLFVRGNLELFNSKSVGFCGSRKASDSGIKITGELVNQLVKKEINIVSGYAQGIDMAAHQYSLLANGVTTFVLSTGILNFKLKNNLFDLIEPNNHLIISEFLPRLGWHVQNAMQRNKTIIGLSDVMILVESKLKGGTLEAGKESIKLKQPLFVVEYQDQVEKYEGNKYLLKQGANSILIPDEKPPNIDKVIGYLSKEKKHTIQTSLF